MEKIYKYGISLVKEKSKKYENTQVINSDDVVKVFNDFLKMNKKAEEVFALMTLNTNHDVTGVFEVFHGSVNFCFVNPADIFKRALLTNSPHIIVAHNHPSGNITPSIEDLQLTKKIQEGCKLLGLKLVDHIIISSTENEYCSLAKNKEI